MISFWRIQAKIGKNRSAFTNFKITYKYNVIKQEISFTEAFNRAIKAKLLKKPDNQFLRLQISAGEGCQGFTYKFKFDTTLSENDYVYRLKDNQSQAQKIAFAANGEQLKLLKGAVMDYSQQMMREVFFVKQNPNAQISCSCKTSFAPKDYLL